LAEEILQNYEVALFLHIVGLAGLFSGIGIETAVLHFARRAESAASVGALVNMGAVAGRAIPVFALLLLLSGAYMVEDVWGWDTPWVYVSLVVFLVFLAMGPLVSAQRMKAIATAAEQAGDGPVTGELRKKLDDPLLTTLDRTMMLGTVGIIYLMTTKPDQGDAILAIALFIGLGMILSVPAWLGTSARTS
jgi:hypothetical protein